MSVSETTESKLAILEEWIDRLQRKAAGAWQLIESAPRISRVLVGRESGSVSIAARINTPDGTAWEFDDRGETDDDDDHLVMWCPIPPLPRRNFHRLKPKTTMPPPDVRPASRSEEALAEAWASIDGKLARYHANKADRSLDHTDGSYPGYIAEAQEMIRRLESRGYTVVATKRTDG